MEIFISLFPLMSLSCIIVYSALLKCNLHTNKITNLKYVQFDEFYHMYSYVNIHCHNLEHFHYFKKSSVAGISKHYTVFCHYKSTFSKILYKCNHRVYVCSVCLASFTLHNAPENHPCRFMQHETPCCSAVLLSISLYG